MPFVEALAAIALALCDPSVRAASARAKEAAAHCDAPAFVHAVSAFANQHENVGMLSNFVAQITRDRSEAAPLALEILGGRVRVDGTLARVSGRELELLAAIAQRREPTLRGRLAAMLWPDLDDFAARNALSVCLHRLRAHLGREDAVEREADGYRLHADAFVDVWEIDRAAWRCAHATGCARANAQLLDEPGNVCAKTRRRARTLGVVRAGRAAHGRVAHGDRAPLSGGRT